MPWIFIRWFLLRLVRNIAGIWIALTLLLLLFDLLANAGEVALGDGPTLLALLFYFLFRLPIVANFILPASVLIASVQTFGSLSARREILAMEASGFTLPKLATLAAVGVALLSVLQFFAADRLVPDLLLRLNQWKDHAYAGLPLVGIDSDNPEWLASGEFLVHLNEASADGTRMIQPTILELDDEGKVQRYWHAAQAFHGKTQWTFEDASGRDFARGAELDPAEISVPMAMPPAFFPLYSRKAEELDFAQLNALARAPFDDQTHPRNHYRLWQEARVVVPAGNILMALMAAPLCLQRSGGHRRVTAAVIVIAAGFLFFIVQNILFAFGEQGLLNPLAAAWAALSAFGLAAIAAIHFRVR